MDTQKIICEEVSFCNCPDRKINENGRCSNVETCSSDQQLHWTFQVIKEYEQYWQAALKVVNAKLPPNLVEESYRETHNDHSDPFTQFPGRFSLQKLLEKFTEEH